MKIIKLVLIAIITSLPFLIICAHGHIHLALQFLLLLLLIIYFMLFTQRHFVRNYKVWSMTKNFGMVVAYSVPFYNSIGDNNKGYFLLNFCVLTLSFIVATINFGINFQKK
jgi:hypothetical protein